MTNEVNLFFLKKTHNSNHYAAFNENFNLTAFLGLKCWSNKKNQKLWWPWELIYYINNIETISKLTTLWCWGVSGILLIFSHIHKLNQSDQNKSFSFSSADKSNLLKTVFVKKMSLTERISLAITKY